MKEKAIVEKPPNTAYTRKLGFALPKEVNTVLERFPAKQFRLVPPTCG